AALLQFRRKTKAPAYALSRSWLFSVAFYDRIGGIVMIVEKQPRMLVDCLSGEIRRSVESNGDVGNRNVASTLIRVNIDANGRDEVAERHAGASSLDPLKFGEDLAHGFASIAARRERRERMEIETICASPRQNVP